MAYVAWIQHPCRLRHWEHCTPCTKIKSVKQVRCRSSLIDRLIASTRRSGVPISLGSSNRTICVGTNCWMISWTIPCWNCDCWIWLRGNWRLIWKSPNIRLAIWCRRRSPHWNVISQKVLMQRWQGDFFLYSAQYIACMPLFMLVFCSWTMPA